MFVVDYKRIIHNNHYIEKGSSLLLRMCTTILLYSILGYIHPRPFKPKLHNLRTTMLTICIWLLNNIPTQMNWIHGFSVLSKFFYLKSLFVHYPFNKKLKIITVSITLILFLSILGISETSPLHQYNLTGDIGDDEVFMVRVLMNE